MPKYNGPDKSFGQRDDYAIGDKVWTYDNAPGVVIEIENIGHGNEYRIGETADHEGRWYGSSRLALVARSEVTP